MRSPELEDRILADFAKILDPARGVMQLQDMWTFRIFGVLPVNNYRSGNNACICSDSLLSLQIQHSTTAKREYPTTEKRERVINALVAPSQFNIAFF